MYSRYLKNTAFIPQKKQIASKPVSHKLQLDRTDLLVLLIIFLAMQEDRSTMLLTAAFYLFL